MPLKDADRNTNMLPKSSHRNRLNHTFNFWIILENLADISTECFGLHQNESED